MGKVVKVALFTAVTVLLASGMVLADTTGWYVGASGGRSTIDIGIIPKEPTNIGYKLYGGYRFGPLALEGGYVNFGDTSDDFLFLPLDIEIDGWGIFGILNLPLGPIDLFGKVGRFSWDYKMVSALPTVNEEGTDSSFGIGGAVRVGPVGVRAEAEVFNIEPIEKVVFFTAGVTYAF